MLMREILIAWVVLRCCSCWELTIVHTNDMHARIEEGSKNGARCYEPSQCYGGFARVKYFADWAKRTYDNVLFLNAGDNFQGTPYYSLFKWKIMESFVDIMGIDVMSLGNHEFDDGILGLEPYLKRVKTPWICANLEADNEPLFKDIVIKPWHFIKVQGKLIAIIGYLTPETKFLGVTGNLTLSDEIQSLNRAVKQVKKLGADVVIALGHSGWDKDLEIAANVPGLDVVVGGHSHTFHYTGRPLDPNDIPVANYPHMVKQSETKVVPLVQAYAYTKYIGFLNLTFDHKNNLLKATGNPVLLDQVIPQDETVLKMLLPWKSNMSHLLEEVIGYTDDTLDSSTCRMEECNFGNLITDAMIDHRRRQYQDKDSEGWTDSPVAILNSGDVRAPINPKNNGSVTVGDLLTSVPFDGTLIQITVNGSTFKDILEYSVHRYDPTGANKWGEFLQFSGVQVTYNVSRDPGDRVVKAQVRCGLCQVPVYHQLDPESQISFITTGFVSDGGDGYVMLKTAQKQNLGETPYFDVIKNFIRRQSPVNAVTEGRITFD